MSDETDKELDNAIKPLAMQILDGACDKVVERNAICNLTAERDALREVVADCREEFEYISDRGGIPLWVYSACKVRIKAIDAAKGGAS